ncbi:MAG: LysE family transporter [Candidatus Bathyarchaeota archaeon]|nr:MAG: LysE family transporter [Candidatus Bathyarchaeota archaeon]
MSIAFVLQNIIIQIANSTTFMEILDFIVTVVLVTASGALAPGPLFVVNLTKGSRLGARGGIVFSVAHTLAEFTLVMLLTFGLLLLTSELVKIVIGVAGGAFLVAFGVMQIYGALKPKSEGLRGINETNSRHLLVIGLAFTGLNPFFIIWWLTAGAQLIVVSLEFASLAGVLLMYVCHVWMDYAWLITTAHLSKKGMNVVGVKWYRILIAFFGAVLIYFGLAFLTSSI